MPENMKIDCPFCGKNNVDVIYTPSMRIESRQSFGRSHTKSVVRHSKEKYEVRNDCPDCGASAKKIQNYLNTGEDFKKPSRKEILERMRSAGLATRI